MSQPAVFIPDCGQAGCAGICGDARRPTAAGQERVQVRVMLRSLHVKNMALIEEEELELEDGLNILTGETGAGKSIVIGSINVALGLQSFRDYLKEDSDYALVELTFETGSGKVREKLEKAGLPCMDDEVIISRRYQKGRSVSRVNGETVPAGTVREIATALIDLYGQHEHQSLLYPRYHLALVDDYAADRIREPKKRCAEAFQVWSETQRELKEALSDEKERLKQIDFLSYEINEIDEASLREGEDGELENRFRILSHAQKIQETLAEAESLTDGDDGAMAKLSRVSRALVSVASLDGDLQGLSDEMAQIEDLMNDFSRSLADYIDGFIYDEQELNEIGARLDLINRLKSKYGREIRDILAYRNRQLKELDRLENYDAYVEDLKKKRDRSRSILKEACDEISRIRQDFAAELKERITRSLRELNFLDVQFEISLKQLDTPTANGADEAIFLISTNPGMPLKPLQNVASGGELSRIMLAIKTVMAEKDGIEALIFDEIDTGISGRTAQKVAEKMAQLSSGCQVIAITHLAQIAAMADHHFLIEKYVEDGMTHTGVRGLNEEEQTEELARILSGTLVTDAVRSSAEEMKRLAYEYKESCRR